MASEQSQGLRADLERAQSTLKETLDKACTTPIEDADTGELIRLEEVLAIANEAAKEAVSVRRRLSAAGAESGAEGGVAADSPASREVHDERGVRWLVFTVHPSAKAGRAVIREAYRGGWLSFDSGVETRRVAPIPDGWERMADAELLTLLSRAETARRPQRKDAGEETQIRD